jgi:hypothetical protein
MVFLLGVRFTKKPPSPMLIFKKGKKQRVLNFTCRREKGVGESEKSPMASLVGWPWGFFGNAGLAGKTAI